MLCGRGKQKRRDVVGEVGCATVGLMQCGWPCMCRVADAEADRRSAAQSADNSSTASDGQEGGQAGRVPRFTATPAVLQQRTYFVSLAPV